MSMREVVAVSAVRSAIGRYTVSLYEVSPIDLGSVVMTSNHSAWVWDQSELPAWLWQRRE